MHGLDFDSVFDFLQGVRSRGTIREDARSKYAERHQNSPSAAIHDMAPHALLCSLVQVGYIAAASRPGEARLRAGGDVQGNG